MTTTVKTYRDFILEGNLPLPQQLVALVKNTEALELLWSGLWFNYVKNKGRTSSAYYLEQHGDVTEFNGILEYLTKTKWITVETIPNRNWSEMWLNEAKLLKFVTKPELDSIRIMKKLRKYTLSPEYTESADKTKLNGKVRNTGVLRRGFAKAGNSEFKFDISTVLKYEALIRKNVHKAMDKLDLDYSVFADKADYMSVCDKVLDGYISNPNHVYTTGENINDSRGRAISQSLKKIFNPISNKDARALLRTSQPRVLDKDALKAIHLFIAELTGVEARSFDEKAYKGQLSWLKKIYPVTLEECSEDYTNCNNDEDVAEEKERAEKARKDFHETIWLERIYNGLDAHNNDESYLWDIPIELDGTASMLQIQGVLLGHETFLHKTNVINAHDLQDAWKSEGIGRTAFKKVATPVLYGSSATAQALWAGAKYAYTAEELILMNRELRFGYLAVAQSLKDFIINNVKPKAKMTVKIWGEKIDIECNRYSKEGDYVQRYDIYDSATGNVETIFHTITSKEPDLEQFKRFFVTLLIHHLDSRVADSVCMDLSWVIPIHDAFIVHPCDAMRTRLAYCAKLDAIYADREKILTDFFYSIGIDSKASAEWARLMKKVKKVKNFKSEISALK